MEKIRRTCALLKSASALICASRSSFSCLKFVSSRSCLKDSNSYRRVLTWARKSSFPISAQWLFNQKAHICSDRRHTCLGRMRLPQGIPYCLYRRSAGIVTRYEIVSRQSVCNSANAKLNHVRFTTNDLRFHHHSLGIG